MGYLAARQAAGFGGRATDTEGAMRTLDRGPLGTIVLAAVALGLLAYASWRFAQAVFDLDREGGGWKGRAVRAGAFLSGVLHLGLAATAATLADGRGGGGSGDDVQTWTSRAFGYPLGPWIVGLAGAGVLAAGAHQVVKAWHGGFEEHWRVRSMSEGERRWARRLGRAGFVTRGVTFGLIGWFLLKAALETDVGEARGLTRVLKTLRGYEHGDVLLFSVGVGLAAYGMLSLVDAKYRRIGK